MEPRSISSRAHVRAIVSISVLCAILGWPGEAQAYHVDAKTQKVTVVSVQDFDKCQRAYESSGSEACLDALKVYVKKHPSDAFEAGKRVRYHFMHWVALDFFAPALGKKPSKQRCQDPDVTSAVISGLALPPHYPAVALAKKLTEACWDQLQPDVVADLESSIGYFRTNACPILAGKNLNPVPCLALEQQKPEAKPANLVAELKAVDWKKLNVDPESGVALRGPNGEELMLARTKDEGPGYVLLKFKSVRSPMNQQVLVALERRAGLGKDYVIVADNAEWVVLSERQGQYQAFPKGMPDGVWLYPLRPMHEAFKLPTRREIASEFAVK